MKRSLTSLLLLTALASGLAAQDRPPRTRGQRPMKMPQGISFLENIPYGRGGGRDLLLDLYLPGMAKAPLPVIVWLHGDDWRSGSKTKCRATRMAVRGYAVASVGYRLSREAAFPAQIHDVKAAVRWLRSHSSAYGLDAGRIGAWGTSAGGHLASLLGTTGGHEALEGSGGSPEQSSRVQAVCDWCGPSDLVRLGGGESRGRLSDALAGLLGGPVGERTEVARLASPITHVSAAAPPFLIMHGTDDRIVPIEQSRVLHDALASHGVESSFQQVEGEGHALSGPLIDLMVDAFFDRVLKGEEPIPLHERSFESTAAGGPARYLLYLPPGYEAETERRYPAVYWLHGRGGGPRGGLPFVKRIDAAIRGGRTPPMIVVLPDSRGESLYCDAKDGSNPVETIIVRETVAHVDATCRTVASREGRAVEGFSMGAFGAAHLGFKFPEVFCAVSICGGALHDEESLRKRRGRDFARVFGSDPARLAAESPWRLARVNADRLRGRTRIRLVVGARDAYLDRSTKFHALLDELDVPHGFVVATGVGHRHERLYEETRDLTAEFYSEVFR